MQDIIDALYTLIYLFISNWGLILLSIICAIVGITIFFVIDYNAYTKTSKSLWHKFINKK